MPDQQIDLFAGFDFEVKATPDAPAHDSRPLPLIVAERWGFRLQHHIVDGVEYFAAIDWVGGMTGNRDAAGYLRLSDRT